MRSAIFSLILLSSVSGLLVDRQTDEKMIRNAVERSPQQAENSNGHLRLLTKRSVNALSPKKHRRHHSKKEKRGTCSSDNAAVADSTADPTEATYTTPTASSGMQTTGGSVSDASVTMSADASSSTYEPSSGSTSGNASDSSSSGNSSGSSGGTGTSASSLGAITGFQGTNTGIGSWFQTDSTRDDTDGTSWCQLKYQDSWMGFAPSVQTMLANFGNDYNKATSAYCGREAKATNPSNGKTALIYIVDGFAQQWVKTPGSIDLTVAAFTALYGSSTTNKDIVIQNLQWELTGNVNEAYTSKA